MIYRNKVKHHATVAALTLLGAMAAQPALAATQVMQSTVNIDLRPLETQMKEALDFGDIQVGSQGGTVSVSNDGSNTISNTGGATPTGGGAEGQLVIKGEKGEAVTVTVDPTVTLNPENKAEAAALTVDTQPQGQTYQLLADNGNDNIFFIGGTLTVPANQPADTYTGSFNAIVEYQ